MKSSLNEREAILYRMFCDDCLSDKQVAYEIGKSISTVRHQKRGLIRKMGVACTAELIKKYHTEKQQARVIQMFPQQQKVA
ncbi:MAG: response regulator transcription factor [Niabella sp.]|nr:response regulator transcription factor [Niabella sp.]